MFHTLARSFTAAAFSAALLLGASPHAAQAADLVKLKMAEVVRSQFYIPMYVALSKGLSSKKKASTSK